MKTFEELQNIWDQQSESNIKPAAEDIIKKAEAHTKKIKRYSGTTPAAFARKTKKEILNIDFVAFVQS